MLSPQKHICNMTFVSCFTMEKSFQKGKVSNEASQAGGNSQHRNCISTKRVSPAESALGDHQGPLAVVLNCPSLAPFGFLNHSKKDTFINSFINDSISNSLAFEHQAEGSTGSRLRISPEAIKQSRSEVAKLLT